MLAAGRRLHLAPSGISQYIAALERETGLVLLDCFRRGGQRPAQLTAAGRLLVSHATRLADVIAEAEADIQAFTGPADGPVVLAAFPTVIARLVVPALIDLMHANRGITPIVREISQQAAVAALPAGDVDVVLIEDGPAHPRAPDPGCAIRWLLDDPYRVAVPTSWAVAISLADLAERPRADGPTGSAIGQALGRLRTAAALSLPAAHTCLEYPAALAPLCGKLALNHPALSKVTPPAPTR